jgi:hypothetical protein
MDLNYQIEQKKKKRAIINDFEIDSTYIKELASEVLNADEKAPQPPSFGDTCHTLRRLCERVAVSAIALKEMIPGTEPSPPPPEE